MVDFEFVVFTKRVKPVIRGWESLLPYEVGIIRGWKILGRNIRSDKAVRVAKSPEILFQMLLDERVELIVYSGLNGRCTIREKGFDGVTALEPPLAVQAVFLYLHKSQEALAPRLAEALRSLKRNGTYERLRQTVLTPYLP